MTTERARVDGCMWPSLCKWEPMLILDLNQSRCQPPNVNYNPDLRCHMIVIELRRRLTDITVQ